MRGTPVAAPVVARAAQLDAITLRDFRNIAEAEVRLEANGIVVVGDNGQGKSNLVEAIAYFRLLRSARGARDRDLIRFGESAFHLSVELSDAGAHRAGIGVDKQGRKRVTLDGGEPERLTDALDTLPSVTFAPRDVDLVAGAPAERRRYLDITLALTSPAYLNALRRYRAALLRRNASLRGASRAGRGAQGAIAAWEPSLAEEGAVLVAHRREWVAEQGAEYARLCAAVGEAGVSAIAYDSTLADAADPRAAILGQLERQREQDIRRGLTQAGPHRDDLALSLDAHDLRVVGSAGQQRSAAIVLRLLESATHTSRSGVTPLLLLDDPFAELDRHRTARILNLIEASAPGQVVLAVPREDEIPARFTRLARWRVERGAFAPEEGA